MTTKPTTASPHGSRRPPPPDLVRGPYFISTRTNSTRRIFRGDIARLAVKTLHNDRERYGFLLLAFALMPDHAHFIIVPAPSRSISETMNAYIEYIHQNPVNAGLVERDEEYQFSSASDASLVAYRRWFEEERE